MRPVSKRITLFAATAVAILISMAADMRGQTGFTTNSGSLADRATYLIEVSANWIGTLFLHSHGYVLPGASNPAQDVGDPITRFFMISSG